jgi:hypothetical protein
MSHTHLHSFHIPVLGLCYSIDTPLKVARYGISSVISIIEDELLEHMRAYHCLRSGKSYEPVAETEPDYRAKRITAYLDLVQELVSEQTEALRSDILQPGTELWKYLELLPEQAPLRKKFEAYRRIADLGLRAELEPAIRKEIVAGAIDVNIMAKVDRTRYDAQGNKLPDEYSDALSALRGFAQSKLRSSVVFSAGYNPRLYAYTAQFPDFFPDEDGALTKKIILKVSDYRSALVQGKLLAKKGLWVSEFRLESGLNCGGHAFATEGLLMGPILQEFKEKRAALHSELLELCNKALAEKELPALATDAGQKITAQGGIGTAAEQQLLLDYYELDGTGWGSPFLLVPEATNVDDDTLSQLATATPEDYYLSHASPLGVPFNNFRKSSSEAQRLQRIAKNRPGSPCYKEYLVSNTEFSELPICTASRKYQHRKLAKLETVSGPSAAREAEVVLEKDCLCEGLTSSVRLKNEMYLPHKLAAVAICPGPNLAFFSGTFTLQQMVDHIYGRTVITNSVHRPHMFLNELQLYVDYFGKYVMSNEALSTTAVEKFRANLLKGIAYYRHLLPDAATDLDRYAGLLAEA